MKIDEFFRIIDRVELKSFDRALALLWFAGSNDPARGLTSKQVCSVLERNGHPKQNATRLNEKLSASRETSKGISGEWRLHPTSRKKLDAAYLALLEVGKQFASKDEVLPEEVFSASRGYIKRVVFQLNASYAAQLFDCCAVMARRLIETLIIETYEAQGRASEIKDPDDNFLMLSGLQAKVESDKTIHLGRNAGKALKDFKRLGDLAAHNRRFNARKDDIDRVRDGLRVLCEELLHLSGLLEASEAAEV